MNKTEEVKKKLQQLKDFYAEPSNAVHARIVVDKNGNVVEDKDGNFLIEHHFTGVYKDSNEAEFTIDHLISTPRIDYVRDVMNPFGCDDTALQKNKGVFYNHEFSGPRDLPIGKNLWLKKTREGVLCSTKYAVNESAFAGDVYRLVKGGYLNSYSIGFRTGEYDIVTIESLKILVNNAFDIPNINEYELSDMVWYHKTWKMHEYSQVGVAMNQDAVQKFMRKALDENIIHSEFGKQYFGSMAERVKTVINSEEDANQIDLKTLKETSDQLTILIKDLKSSLESMGTLVQGVSEKQDQCVVMLEHLVDSQKSIAGEEEPENEDEPTEESEEEKENEKPGESAGEKLIDFDVTDIVKQSAAGALSRATGKITN